MALYEGSWQVRPILENLQVSLGLKRPKRGQISDHFLLATDLRAVLQYWKVVSVRYEIQYTICHLYQQCDHLVSSFLGMMTQSDIGTWATK